MDDPYIQSSLSKKADATFDSSLRPGKIEEFLGQPHLKECLDVFTTAAKTRGEPIGHCLFHGPPGLGKTTLASILARTCGSTLVNTTGPALEKPGDLAGILTSLNTGDLLFVDEIHRLPRNVEEYLYSAMEDFSLDLVVDNGPSARSVQVHLNRFTLVGASTQIGLISSPLRSRFNFSYRLDFYDIATLKQIVSRSAQILGAPLTESAAHEIAVRSRGTPRIANHLLRWVRDFATAHNKMPITEEIAAQALAMLSIDERGLDEMDKKLLSLIIDHHGGGPVGLTTLAIAVGEAPATLEEVYEPYLIMAGFLKRTPRGREATALAYSHLHKKMPKAL